MPRPIIGILGGYRQRDRQGEFYLNPLYFDAVELAGGVPVVLPPCREKATLASMLRAVDGLLLPGSPDLHPSLYGQSVHPAAQLMHPRRQAFDLRCVAAAFRMRLPILGICGGAQLINVHFGGTLHQDIPSLQPPRTPHKPGPGSQIRHKVSVMRDTLLHRIVGVTRLETNSYHHQSIERVGRGMRVCARSDDGIIEAVEVVAAPFALALQWHPEGMVKRHRHLALFEALVEAARKRG